MLVNTTPTLTYKGLILKDFSVTNVPSWNRERYSRNDWCILPPPNNIISFRINAINKFIARAAYDEFNGGCPVNFATLGDGTVCPYCDQYNPSGRLLCWACGGPVERVPFIRPVQLPPMYSTTLHQDCILSLDEPRCINIDVELTCHEHLGTNEHLLPLLRSGVLDRFHNGLSLTGAWLCAWCGSSIESDKDCPLCGGNRFPFDELVKIDRDCLYCGQRVKNGLICRACGSKLAGLTYKALGMATKGSKQ